VDAVTAGRVSWSIDPLHCIAYFVPDAEERYEALGMRGQMPYFAARSAPMAGTA
jgi:hypothetical protein